MNMNIGKGLKFVRLASGLRQGELAKKLGISQNYLSLLENNKSEPSLTLLKRISQEFNVPASFLLWEENMPTEGNTPEISAAYNEIRSLMHEIHTHRIKSYVEGECKNGSSTAQ